MRDPARGSCWTGRQASGGPCSPEQQSPTSHCPSQRQMRLLLRNGVLTVLAIMHIQPARRHWLSRIAVQGARLCSMVQVTVSYMRGFMYARCPLHMCCQHAALSPSCPPLWPIASNTCECVSALVGLSLGAQGAHAACRRRQHTASFCLSHVHSSSGIMQ